MEFTRKEKAAFNLKQMFGQHSVTALICKILAALMLLIGVVISVAWWARSGFMFLFIVFFLGMCVMAFLCYALGHVIEMNCRNYETNQQILETMTVLGADPDAFYLTEPVYLEELEGLDIEGDPEQFALEDPGLDFYALDAPEFPEGEFEGEFGADFEEEPAAGFEEALKAEAAFEEAFEPEEEAWLREESGDDAPAVIPPGMTAAEYEASKVQTQAEAEPEPESFEEFESDAVPGEEPLPEPGSDFELVLGEEPEPEEGFELESEDEEESDFEDESEPEPEDEEELEQEPELEEETESEQEFEPAFDELEVTAEFPAVLDLDDEDEEEPWPGSSDQPVLSAESLPVFDPFDDEDEEDEYDEDEPIIVGRHSRH